MPTTPALWKGPTQVNTSDGGAIQANGQITPLANGGYVVVWADGSLVHNPNGFAILGQVYNALGEKVGGEALLSASAHAFQPEVVTLENGNIAVAFIDHGANDNVLVRIFDPTLALVRIDTIADSALHEFNPSLTALGGGGYGVTYAKALSATNHEVMARIVSASGVVGAEFEVFSVVEIPADRQGESAIAKLSNGNIVAVIQDEVGGSTTDHDLGFAIRSPTGTPLGGGMVAGANSTPADETRPDVAALTGGGFVVVWTDTTIDGAGTGIGATVYNNLGERVNDGGSSQGIVVNNSTEGSQNDATVVALADGGFLVAWENEQIGDIRGQRFDAFGTAIGAEFVLANSVTLSSTETPIRLALLADGRVAFVANAFDGADYDVVTSIWDPRDAPNGGTGGEDILTSLSGGSALSGLGGNDTLIGAGGPDTLDGGPGGDLMQGGGGDDTYVVDNASDQVIEAPGQGTDIVLSAISFALGANVENLTLIGGAIIDGFGNELANVITGNDAANVLGGGLGNDSLIGRLGADSFLFNTALDAATNVDTLADFSHSDDTILLDNAIFTKLKKDGDLKKKYFEVGKKADDKDDYIVYNKKTGELSYDADGSKKKIEAIAFADLAEGLKLKADDFLVI